MTDHTVRELRPEENRAAADLFRATLHVADLTDGEWALARGCFQPGRTLGAFDSELIGTARSFDAELTVPGDRKVPMAAVTGVGVRPDRTRRGVLSALMRAQFEDFTARGMAVSSLRASEGAIYGRFGYGVATLAKNCSVDRRRARFRPEIPDGGEVTVIKLDEAVGRWPELYDAVTPPRDARPGLMNRPPYSWVAYEADARRAKEPVVTVVHREAEGVTGVAVYRVERPAPRETATLDVTHFRHTSPAAFAGLWRYLMSVDLVDTITAGVRPLDEPVELLFTDPRQCRVTGTMDETWLRLVDVDVALDGREYGEYDGPPIVLDVVDPLLERNSGRYRVSADGSLRTGEPADLRLGVDTLAMLYLGAWRASALAAVGRIEARDPRVLDRADALFGTRRAAWCGTFF
ncbi:GNAT family N-acetyltransferase [Amycolatopsis sp. H20-H5]|uniref:GNAT family N-acetyltransferase n=1 Tax=Amycolatopsis sp. H20-H5 TaxID=3046309 RepID=UPI002DB5A138|nr:GNAT family N-acetyltransferase [Amycolatopsis sp. H20-H5]MEC3979362.1 GNAT family N-acetyltransferase [Amycolatopsis sp. H20-H5]